MNEATETNSIYQAPASDTATAATDDLIAACVGPKNRHYYLQRFEKFAAGGSPVSWNWPAFFMTWFWLMYRKMWMWSFVYWLGLPIVLSVLLVVLLSVLPAEQATTSYYLFYAIIIFVLAPMFANRLYYGHVRSKVASVSAGSLSPEQQAVELERIGGTSKVVFIIAPLVLVAFIGIIAAIAIPAYQDYTIRGQVAEGLNLSGGVKAAVTESYLSDGRLPADNRTAGLPEPEEISGAFVSEVAVYQGAVVVTYGNGAHEIIRDHEIVFEPEVGAGEIRWQCYSQTIKNKHLPAVCR